MANSFDASLVTAVVAQRTPIILQQRLAPLANFTSDFSDEMMPMGSNNAPLRQIVLPVGVAAATVLTNPSNFEQGDTTVSAVTITPTYYSRPFHVTSQEQQVGHRLERLIDVNLHKLCDAIWAATLSVVPTTFNSAAIAVSTTSNLFTTDGQQFLWGSLAKSRRKTLLLDGTLFAKFLPTTLESFGIGTDGTSAATGAYGWNGGIFNVSLADTAKTNVKALALGDDAICVASAIPEVSEAVTHKMLAREIIPGGELGISIAMHHWGSTVSRAEWMSFDVVFGSAAGAVTGGVIGEMAAAVY